MGEPIIEINQGKLKGRIAKDYKGGKYFSFQGIPYAKPPIGNLRFKAPVLPEKWAGILDATKEANSSLTRNFLEQDKVTGSEDCLYLNVFTSELPTNENFTPKPVMVWIHGGGFIYGSGNSDIYGPDFLVSEDIVLVTINYRLGMLGFLSFEDSSLGVPGNAGLKDMVQALKWVQENISSFGGDPTNVTIFGESAGGTACHLLMLSPMGKGLFHKVILQSSTSLHPWVFGYRAGKKVAKLLGLESNNEKDVLEFLRSVDEIKFMDAQDAINDGPTQSCSIRPNCVIIEKPSTCEPNFLTEHPLKIIASGNYYKVPIMIGYTDREGILMEFLNKKTSGSLITDSMKDFENYVPWYYNLERGTDLSKEVALKVKEFYFQNKDISEENIENYFLLEGDLLFWRGVYLMIKEHLKNFDIMYFYKLSLVTRMNLFKEVLNLQHRSGTSHCDDLGYLFKSKYGHDIEPNTKEEQGVQKVLKLWTNFAKYNNPTKNMSIKWEPVEKNSFNCLDIGDKLTVIKNNTDMDRMKFWDNLEKNPLIKLF